MLHCLYCIFSLLIAIKCIIIKTIGKITIRSF